jgi:hypothetical protein
MNSDQTFVIVGASLAGAKAAETLRAEGFAELERDGVRSFCDSYRELLRCIESKLRRARELQNSAPGSGGSYHGR